MKVRSMSYIEWEVHRVWLGGTRELLRTYNGTTTELPAVTTGRRLDFSKDITRFSHFFTLNNVENDEMSFFFSNFAADFSRL